MGKPVKKPIAPFLAILAGFLWGTIGFFVRYLTSLGLSNMTIVACRMAGAVLMMAVCLIIYDRRLLKIRIKDLWCFIGTGMISMVFLNFFYNISIKLTSLSLAAILLATAPIFVIFLGRVLFEEKITRIKILSFLLAFIGCVFVCGIFDGGTNYSVLGILAGLASGFFYGLYSIFSRLAINKGYHLFTIIIYSFFFATIGASLFADFHPLIQLVKQSPFSINMILFLHSLLVAVAPYSLYTISLKYLDTGRASILTSGEPVVATFLGLLLYREVPSLLAVIGIALVLVALALLSKPEKMMTQSMQE